MDVLYCDAAQTMRGARAVWYSARPGLSLRWYYGQDGRLWVLWCCEANGWGVARAVSDAERWEAMAMFPCPAERGVAGEAAEGESYA